MIRDEEIRRLKKYAEGLGAKIIEKPSYKGCGGGDWDCDTRTITYYTDKHQSKTDIILNLLHELGHHLDWIYKGKKISKKVLKACEVFYEGVVFGSKAHVSREYRKIIYEEERDGIFYMDIIWKECGLKLPLWKVKLRQYLDLLDYNRAYLDGRFTTAKEYRAIRKEAIPRFKKRYGA